MYLGSFWEHPPSNPDTAKLLLQEMTDLLKDLMMLPRQGCVRKVNEIVKRARKVRVLACLLDYLRHEMPSFSADRKKEKLLGNMEKVRTTVCKKYDLSPGDFPDIPLFVETVRNMDFKNFPALKGKRLLNGKLLEQLEIGVKRKIPSFLEMLPSTNYKALTSFSLAVPEPAAPRAVSPGMSPHGYPAAAGS